MPACFYGGYSQVYAANTRMFLQWVFAYLHSRFIILFFIVLEAVTFMVLYQNYGNTFGNFINVTASNILNFKIKKIKNPLCKPTGTRHINQRVPVCFYGRYPLVYMAGSLFFFIIKFKILEAVAFIKLPKVLP